jgi:acylphosphatase
VKNLFDGMVEIVAEGEEERINKFLDIIRSFGKPISIKNVSIAKEIISSQTYQSFATR